MGLAGREQKEALGDKVLRTSAHEHSVLQDVQLARKFTLALPCLSQIIQNELLSPSEVLLATNSPTEDGFLSHSFLPKVFQEARKEVTADEEKVPGQTILKHSFFELKVLEDGFAKAEKKHAAAQKKYGKMTDKLVKAGAKKRKAAEMECSKIMDGDTVGKEQKLARRNQINRRRKGIKKIKKVRSEENLPEAGGMHGRRLKCFLYIDIFSCPI